MNTTKVTREKNHLDHALNASDDAPFVSKVFGAGDDTYRFAWVNGWLLKVPMHRFDYEPRVCDTHMADCVELDNPNPLREMILCFIAEEIPIGQHAEMALRRWGAELDKVGDVEFWLTETQAVDVLFRSELAVDPVLFNELLAALAKAREMRAQGALDPAQIGSRPYYPALTRVDTQALIGKSVARKKTWARHRELLENPETLAQLYGMLASRIEQESWYPVLRTPS